MIKQMTEWLRDRYELSLFEDLILPLALLVTLAATMIWFYSNAFNATVHKSCKYQYFIVSPDKYSAGTAIVFCKLADGRIVSGYKTAPWMPPAISSDMEIDIPK